MVFTDSDRAKAHKGMEKSMTSAQKLRRSRLGRPRIHDLHLTPLQAVFEACKQMDEVQTEMISVKPPLDKRDSCCALVVRTIQGGKRVFHTFLISPNPEDIGHVVSEITSLKNPVPIGILFRVTDRAVSPPVHRDWAKPFIMSPKDKRGLDESVKDLEALASALKQQAQPGAGMS
jgi:hypothetical protein